MTRRSERQKLLHELRDALTIEASVREHQRQLQLLQGIMRGDSVRKALLNAAAQATGFGTQDIVIHLVCQWLLLSPVNARPSLAKLIQDCIRGTTRADNAGYYALIESNQYLYPRVNRSRDHSRIQFILYHEDEENFRSHARMSRQSFKKLVALIQDHEEFQYESFHIQEPVEVQLLTTLRRFGLSGNGASYIQNKSNTQIPGKSMLYPYDKHLN